MSQVVTASRLGDGAVVFFGGPSGWVERLDQAVIFEGKENAAMGLDAAVLAEADNLIVDPYAIDVSTHGGSVAPTKLREAIRARGPTIHPEFAKPGSLPPTAPEDDHVSV